MMTLGIDVGSMTTKAALLDGATVRAACVIPTGYHANLAARRAYEAVLADGGVPPESIQGIVVTGYGRNNVPFAHRAVTEISCHAAGVHHLSPDIRTVVDIGGQDSKVIALDLKGKVRDFAMNDKCAAGTGRFLEVMAGALEVDLAEMGPFALSADRPSVISSMCTVFAESEVISLIARQEQRADIIAGICDAVAARVAAMVGRVGLVPPVMMTGGVALNPGVVRALAAKIGAAVAVSPQAQLTGAIGAALLARRVAFRE